MERAAFISWAKIVGPESPHWFVKIQPFQVSRGEPANSSSQLKQFIGIGTCLRKGRCVSLQDAWNAVGVRVRRISVERKAMAYFSIYRASAAKPIAWEQLVVVILRQHIGKTVDCLLVWVRYSSYLVDVVQGVRHRWISIGTREIDADNHVYFPATFNVIKEGVVFVVGGF